jgi:lipoprotein-releasing system ATP-binding protein
MELRVQGLKKVYQDASRELTVLQRMDYTFPAGKRIAIIGRSGVGKSTLLHLLGGLDQPTEGEVFYDSIGLFTLSADARARLRGARVGFIFQFHHLLPEFSARENVAMPLLISGVNEEEAYRQADLLLSEVGLRDRLTHRPGQLSGGEQQRVAVSRALVARPALILADEPTGNLDLESSDLVRDCLFRLVREIGATLILVTHNRDLAAQSDVVLEMHPGGGFGEVRTPGKSSHGELI